MRSASAKGFLCVLVLIIGCTSPQNEKTTLAQQRYYYYPKTNVYYDAQSLEYAYSLDSARTWSKMKASEGDSPPVSLGEQVSIKETSDNIWLQNELHRNMYGGVLYNIITKDTIALADKPRDTKKASARQDSSTGTPKKKRNIFQKIFGKKKN